MHQSGSGSSKPLPKAAVLNWAGIIHLPQWRQWQKPHTAFLSLPYHPLVIFLLCWFMTVCNTMNPFSLWSSKNPAVSPGCFSASNVFKEIFIVGLYAFAQSSGRPVGGWKEGKRGIRGPWRRPTHCLLRAFQHLKLALIQCKISACKRALEQEEMQEKDEVDACTVKHMKGRIFQIHL